MAYQDHIKIIIKNAQNVLTPGRNAVEYWYMNKLFKCPKPVLDYNKRGLPKWADGKLVTFPVSQVYNGGTIIDGEWYDGYDVPKPDVPKGYRIQGIGIGFQMNVKPPYATVYMEKIK